MKSLLADELDIRPDLYGRAERVEAERLRGDFASALRNTLRSDEKVQLMLAVRPDKVTSVDIPACVLVLTDRAVIQLREPPQSADVHYGIRSLVIPYKAITAIELGERLLRGSFKISIKGTRYVGQPALGISSESSQSLAIPYHRLDEKLFIEAFALLRTLADI